MSVGQNENQHPTSGLNQTSNMKSYRISSARSSLKPDDPTGALGDKEQILGKDQSSSNEFVMELS